ncbi:hypothetical protein FGRMN_9756 [Fusarium graminum]|nr:hypothetical protein FGRMN_9756 [Fusarium graminum]
MSRFGCNTISIFDVASDARNFLADVIESSQATDEIEDLVEKSLFAGAQDWHYLIECANSMRQAHKYDKDSLHGQDTLTYVRCILDGLDPPPNSESRPWEMTDRLIARAKALEAGPEIRPPFVPVPVPVPIFGQPPTPELLSKTKSRHSSTSHYWSHQPQEKCPRESNKWSALTQLPLCRSRTPSFMPSQAIQYDASRSLSADKLLDRQGSPQQVTHGDKTLSVDLNSTESPYFTRLPVSGVTLVTRRVLPGTVPSVPFAPLTSSEFGLIQEKFAHDQFWLLIVVTFLIKTKGKHAIPVFYEVKKRFPTPADIACDTNTEHIIDMIRHLGLAVHRVTLMQKYARTFLSNPPIPGVRYKVKNYDQRDVDPLSSLRLQDGENQSSLAKDADEQDLEAWEIGHLTQGKYALDSWRIFCRDEFLGRATDWNGGSREPEFQPEWMRVRPDDKELRAFLRWMWMKEGWEWNPATGERTVLRETMREAVNEGRVGYDDRGGLKLIETSSDHPSSPLLC